MESRVNAINYSPIKVVWSGIKRKFVLLSDCTFNIAGEVFVVPNGFLTDFGSIPRLFKPFFDPIGKEVPSYVLHDYLCSLSNQGKFSRSKADKILLESLRESGTSVYRSYMIYAGCRVFSLVRYFQKRKQNERESIF